MTGEFLKALVDAIVPGGELGRGVNAPPASACGVHELLKTELARPGSPLSPVVAKAAMFSGVPTAVALGRFQSADRDGFTHLITFVLTAYYQSPAVIEAFGWPSRPPQPQGHDLPGSIDESLLEPVRQRRPFWRPPG